MFDRWCFESGTEVVLCTAHAVLIETEVAVGMGADLPPRDEPYSEDEVGPAIGWIAPAFEVVAARFSGGLEGNGLLAIADDGLNAAFVCGERISA